MDKQIQSKTRCYKCGKYYDGSLYAVCPYCDGRGVASTEVVSSGIPLTEAVSHGSNNGLPPTEAAGSARKDSRFRATEVPAIQNIAGVPPTEIPISQNRTQRVRYEEREGGARKTEFSGYRNTTAPLVGWLVALEGPCKGTDYRLHTGYNYIGRERGDICIHGDPAISSEKDTSITYMPQNRSFFVAHEHGKNPVLLNDQPVIGGSAELMAHDVITVGNTHLLFIPLCSERFTW